MPSDAITGIFQGLAGGVPQGMRLGYVGREQALDRDKLDAAKAAATAESSKAAMAANIDKGKFYLDAFKAAPQKLKPEYFRAFATFSNDAFGTNISPDAYSESAGNDLNELNQLMDMRGKGLMNDDDFFLAAGKYMTGLDADQQSRAKSALAPLVEMSRQKRTSSNQRLAGEQLLSTFATEKVLKLSGMTDEQIAAGQANGRIPKQLSAKDAALIIPRGMNFNFNTLGAGDPAGLLNAESFSSGLGF